MPEPGARPHTRARSKIRAWFKKQEDEQNLAQGRSTLERELQRLGITEINFEKLARELGYKTPDEMFIALGCGDLSISKVIKQFSGRRGRTSSKSMHTAPQETTTTDTVEVVGLKGMLSNMAKCCNPHARRPDRRLCHPRARRNHPQAGLPEHPEKKRP
jgi:GTP diphosphokinase / guanosine-3',5'-bis(diphosphate) 3'-diphosphatase